MRLFRFTTRAARSLWNAFTAPPARPRVSSISEFLALLDREIAMPPSGLSWGERRLAREAKRQGLCEYDAIAELYLKRSRMPVRQIGRWVPQKSPPIEPANQDRL